MSSRRALVQDLHDSPTQLVLAVTGGGNAVITDLLEVPGASRTVLEVVVPYAATALEDLIGHEPEQSVSESTAVAMAEACLRRAVELSDDDADVVGVACTAALVSDRPKRGPHRAHLAVATRTGSVSHRRVDLEKGVRDRAGEDRVVADVLLEIVARAAGLETGSTFQ